MTNVSLHCFAKLPRRFLSALGLGLGILTIGAIAPPPNLTDDAVSQPPLTLTNQFVQVADVLMPTATVWTVAASNLPEVLTITLYTPSLTCDRYIGAPQVVAQGKPVTQIVRQILSQQVPQLLEFDLAGYRIQRGFNDQSVTIDFRRSPTAARQFESLSVCEGRILLGSLRETLLRNEALNIKTVRFTEQGRPLSI
jgi:hypothetical protein